MSNLIKSYIIVMPVHPDHFPDHFNLYPDRHLHHHQYAVQFQIQVAYQRKLFTLL